MIAIHSCRFSSSTFVLLLNHAHFIDTSTSLTTKAAFPVTNYTTYTPSSSGRACLFQEATSTCKPVLLNRGRKQRVQLPVIIEIILIIHTSLPCHMAVQRPSPTPLTLFSCILRFDFSLIREETRWRTLISTGPWEQNPGDTVRLGS